jgi:hypothetical protein
MTARGTVFCLTPPIRFEGKLHSFHQKATQAAKKKGLVALPGIEAA